MNDLSQPLIEKQILVLWVSTKGQPLQQEDCDFWKNLAWEKQPIIQQRLIVEPGTGCSEVFDGVSLIDANNLGDRLNQIAKEAPWESIWFIPVGVNLREIVEDLHQFSNGNELDAITFYRTGGKSTIICRVVYWLIKKPLFFLLEIPSEMRVDWQGWNNWFWEKIGCWLLGVHNRDPLFPLRAVKGEWFRRIPFQSRSSWIWMEMLAKLHFLGAKLCEKPVNDTFGQANLVSGGSPLRDFRLVLTKPAFRVEP